MIPNAECSFVPLFCSLSCKTFICKYLLLLLLNFGLSLQFILYHVAGFYKPTIPQSQPSHLQNYSICNNVRLEFSINYVPSFDPNEWCVKNGLYSGDGGSNSQNLSFESSDLTTRPWLLFFFWNQLINHLCKSQYIRHETTYFFILWGTKPYLIFDYTCLQENRKPKNVKNLLNHFYIFESKKKYTFPYNENLRLHN
jgi:hypothetical protein